EASQIAYSPATLVVLGADAAPADLGKMLIAAGWPEGTRLAITWDGTTSAQQTVVSSLGRIGPDLKAAGVSLANTRGSAIAVVGDAVAARDQLSWFETKPLFGWRVLVPRTKEQAALVSQRLREYGAVPEEVPTIAVEPPRTPQQMERAAEGLAAAWPPYDDLLDPINRVLLPRADIATETLLARLIDLGWETEDVTAYRTVRAAPPPAPIREAIKGGGFDAVLFTSSSTVRNLVGIAGKPHAVTVIGVIGPQTAKTAAEFGLRVDVTAPKPSMAALVEAVAEYGAGLRDAAVSAGEPVRRPSERRRGARRRLRSGRSARPVGRQ